MRFRYNFLGLTSNELMHISASNNLVFFFYSLTIILFSIFGFSFGFTGYNFVFGLPYYFYFMSFFGLISSVIYQYIQYKKFNFFNNQKKYIIDCFIFTALFIAYTLNAILFTTSKPSFDWFPQFNWDFRMLVLILIPVSIILWFYVYYTGYKVMRKSYLTNRNNKNL